jgi:hypothetical protein
MSNEEGSTSHPTKTSEKVIQKLRNLPPRELAEACLSNEAWSLLVQDLITNNSQMEFLLFCLSLKSKLESTSHKDLITILNKAAEEVGSSQTDDKQIVAKYRAQISKKFSELSPKEIISYSVDSFIIKEEFSQFIDDVLHLKLESSKNLIGEIRNSALEELVNVFLERNQYQQAKKAAHPLSRLIDSEIRVSEQKKNYAIHDLLNYFQFDAAYAIAMTLKSIRLKAMAFAEIQLSQKIYRSGKILDPGAKLIEQKKYDQAIQLALSIKEEDLQSVVLNDIAIALIDSNPDKAIGAASMIADLSIRDDTLLRMSKIFLTARNDPVRASEAEGLMTYN